MRSFAPLACILILSLPQIAITVPVDQRALIVPGQSVGTLRLKTPLNAVVNAWGPAAFLHGHLWEQVRRQREDGRVQRPGTRGMGSGRCDCGPGRL